MPRPPSPPDPSKVCEAALDVFVYAPIGFALDARELVPKLVERGRNQVALARLFGRYALQRGQAEATRVLAERRGEPRDERPSPAPSAAAASADLGAEGPAAPPRRRTTKGATRSTASEAATATLPIPGYDSLSASQVIPRLDSLRPAELEAVRAHEVANRGRRTILNRIAQLQA